MYTAMSSAISEWFLMLLLFFNCIISYFLTKFAEYCKLQPPCLFCSRLDRILGTEKPAFYRNLICVAHKQEISSLVYCHVHERLTDVNETCETCLLSFAPDGKPSMDAYQSLVRKLEANLDMEDTGWKKLSDVLENDEPKIRYHARGGMHIHKLNDHALDFPRKRRCSCCHRRFRKKSLTHRLLQMASVVADAAEVKGAASGSISSDCIEPLDPVPKRKENQGPHSLKRLSHVGYSELKLVSESEYEVPPSDDDVRSPVPNNNKVSSIQSDPPFIESALEKLIHTSVVEPNTGAAVEKQVFEIQSSSLAEPISNGVLSHGLEELNWNEVKPQTPPFKSDAASDMISSVLTDSKSGNLEIGDVHCVCEGNAATILRSFDLNSSPTSPATTNTDLNDAYKLVIAGRGIEPTPSPRDPNRAQGDLRMLLFQLASGRGLERPSSEIAPSPRICRICEEARPSDHSGPTILHNVTKRFSIERNESGFSSLDESAFSEIEGESMVDRLKRLIEFERKSLILLYKELEEERSASAIAANQAMAMITRLQEEKATMQMEALQYQRMMEEQAEYDQEALQRSNDILAQKDRELQELESEIDAYRKRLAEDDTAFGLDHEEVKAITRKISMGFEDEKIYISKCLKKMEKKLRLYSTKGHYATRSENWEDGKLDSVLENGHCNLSECDVTRTNALVTKETLPSKSTRPNTREIPKSTVIENGKNISSLPGFDSEKKRFVSVDRDGDIIATVSMVSQLNARLESLEVDKNFLEHTINTLRNGDEGLQFIHEIANHLQTLRKAMAEREPVVT